MAQTDALKKYLDAGMAFTALTRARAEQVVKDLVAAGELQRSQAKEAIDDLIERSNKNGETLAEQVRKEVDSQLASLGLVRKGDLERLEAELAELKGMAGDNNLERSAEKAPDKAEKAPAPAPAKKAAGKGTAGNESGGLPAEKSEGSSKAAPAKKAGGKGAAGNDSGQLPAEKSEGKGAPAKKAGSAQKKASSLSSAKDGGDQPVTASSMPAKKSAKKQG